MTPGGPWNIDPNRLNWLAQNLPPEPFHTSFDQISQIGTNMVTQPGLPGTTPAPEPGTADFGFGAMLQPAGATPAKPGIGALPPGAMQGMGQPTPPMHAAPAAQPQHGKAPQLPQMARNVTPPTLAEILSGRKYG